jgi:hypothetical protein
MEQKKKVTIAEEEEETKSPTAPLRSPKRVVTT